MVTDRALPAQGRRLAMAWRGFHQTDYIPWRIIVARVMFASSLIVAMLATLVSYEQA
jgi:hypothetical protein